MRPGSGDIDDLGRQGGGGRAELRPELGWPGWWWAARSPRTRVVAGADAGRTGADRTTRSKGSIDWEPITLTALVDQKWSPFELFFGPVRRPFGPNQTIPF